ncbi:hypothetical protein EV363DRAFT_1171112 [Boletus edulis]|nr:hypothetical protein EV363DRAFT_1171112 [Boletus edulis]
MSTPFLENLEAPLDLVTHRTKYYEFVLRAIFFSFDIPTSKLMFVRGSDYQLSGEYNLDNYKFCTLRRSTMPKRRDRRS